HLVQFFVERSLNGGQLGLLNIGKRGVFLLLLAREQIQLRHERVQQNRDQQRRAGPRQQLRGSDRNMRRNVDSAGDLFGVADSGLRVGVSIAGDQNGGADTLLQAGG